MEYYEIRQFDNVKLRTTRNIKFLSAQPRTMPSPNGIWTVVGIINGAGGKELVITKQECSALCRVPVSDVLLAGRSRADHLMELINGKEETRQVRKEGKEGIQRQGGDDSSD